MKQTTAWLINNAMQDVVTSGTGTTARLSGPEWRYPVKPVRLPVTMIIGSVVPPHIILPVSGWDMTSTPIFQTTTITK